MRSLYSSPFSISVLILITAIIFIRLMAHGEPVLLRNELSDLPIEFDPWRGTEQGLDPKTVEVLGATDYVMRWYVRKNSSVNPPQPLWFFVSYYASQHREASYHSPKICLPGSGWEIVKLERMRIPITSKPGKVEALTLNKVIVQKGLDRQLVLYWYQDRGRIIASEYWAKIYLAWDALTRNRTDGALVRISLPLDEERSADEAFAEGVEFAQQIFPVLGDFLPS